MAGNKQDLARLIKRLEDRQRELAPDSKSMRAAFAKIGSVTSSEMKINAAKGRFEDGRSPKSARIWDTGNLVNNTKYEYFKSGNSFGISVGTFGVRYAAFHEFGTKFSRKMWLYLMATMPKSPRKPKKTKGKKRRGGSKGVIETQLGGAGIEARIRARPYVRPAIEKHRQFIIYTLREAANP